MTADRYDVAVVGTGPVGLTAALAFAQAGLSTCLVGPEPAGGDGRTAALLRPAVEQFGALGIWSDLAARAGALRALRIVDASGSLFRPPPTIFRAEEIGLDAFGWNIPNADLAASLARAVRERADLAWHRALVSDGDFGDRARLKLDDSREIEASLVVAADGRRSRIRSIARIEARERRYRQSAFTTILRHTGDHGDVSTEFHTRQGPFTLVPLPGRRSSLVWVTLPRHAERLRSAPDAELTEAIEATSNRLLGRIAIDGPRGVVPLAAISVDRWTGPRLALVGEAAHVLPPIGAQGLNLGLADVAALAGLAGEARVGGADPGAAPLLARYQRERQGDVGLRALAVDGLNRSLLAAFPPLDAARGVALGLLGGIGPMRRAVMRLGLTGTLRSGPAPAPSRPGRRAARS